MATVTKVWLDETENECTMCGACEATCPEVFEVPEKMIVKSGADFSITSQIVEAAEGCPATTLRKRGVVRATRRVAPVRNQPVPYGIGFFI